MTLGCVRLKSIPEFMPLPSKHTSDQRTRKLFQVCSKPKLSSAERERAQSLARQTTQDIDNPAVAAAIQRIADYFLTRERMKEIGQNPAFPVSDVQLLADRAFSSTVEFAVADSPEAFEALPTAELIARPLSPKLLDRVTKRRKEFLGESIAAVSNAAAEESSFLLDWLVEKAPAKQLVPIVPMLFTECQRRSSVKSMASLRSRLIERDKSGVIVKVILERIRSSELEPASLAAALNSSAVATENFLLQCRKLLSSPLAEIAVVALKRWLADIELIDARQRTLVSAALVEFFAILLRKPKRKPSEESAFSAILATQSRLCASPDSPTEGFWVAVRTSEVKAATETDFQISEDGARLLVESFSKLSDSQFSPVAVIETVALNLGLVPIAESGQRLAFDPAAHEDVDGGLLIGDSCEVAMAGWKFADAVLSKAKVKPIT